MELFRAHGFKAQFLIIVWIYSCLNILNVAWDLKGSHVYFQLSFFFFLFEMMSHVAQPGTHTHYVRWWPLNSCSFCPHFPSVLCQDTSWHFLTCLRKAMKKLPRTEIMTLRFISDLSLVFKVTAESLCFSCMRTLLFASVSRVTACLNLRRCVDNKVSFEVVWGL